jgi:hypothetical protein
MQLINRMPHHGRTFRYTDRDLNRLLGKTVSLGGKHVERTTGRLSLRAVNGHVYFSVLDICFVPDSVKSLRDSAVLPVVVLG